MTGTSTAFGKARDIIERTLSGKFRKHALGMVGELEDLVSREEADAEELVGAYYEKATGTKPYARPESDYLSRKARVVLVCRDLLAGREPKVKYMHEKGAAHSEAFELELDMYRAWMGSLGLSEATVDARLWRANALFMYLEAKGARDVGELDAETLARFIAWLDGRYAPASKSAILYTLRSLFSCPDIAAELAFDPFGLLTNMHTPKRGSIPSVYSADEVAATLAAIDRGTDAGRALYLVVMLAAVYGLRAGDIIELKLRDIDFKRGVINIIQHKTGFPLTLPLVECVKLPLLDYMMNTRRDCEFDNVLIKHRGVPGPYSPRSRFRGPLLAAMEKGGVIVGERGSGLHALRHSLATGLLASGVPADEIARILGHESVEATKTYIWSDVERLRMAALEVG